MYFKLFPRSDMQVNVVLNENAFDNIDERRASSETDKSVMMFDVSLAYELFLKTYELMTFPLSIV